jgi:hypothetical protein
MKGGKIHIEGHYEGLANNIFSGKIFHKGKLVFPKEGGE